MTELINDEIVTLENYSKRNPKVSVYLMQHHPRLKCNHRKCYDGRVKKTIVLRHKTLCKDGKYRVYKHNKEYCGINLMLNIIDGIHVPFASSEMKDLRRLYDYCIKNKVISYDVVRNYETRRC